jgi:hypothetical protein
MPYVMRLGRELVPNCVIKIHGKPNARAEWNLKDDGVERHIFSIGLYHDGLEHIPLHNTQREFIGCKGGILFFTIPILVGDTVMEIDFRASKVGDADEHLFEGIAVFAYYVCTYEIFYHLPIIKIRKCPMVFEFNSEIVDN